MPLNLSSALVRSVSVALLAFVGNMTATQLAWRFDEQTVTSSLETIGEVYLDGLIASIKDAVVQEKPGEVDRRLKAEFTEQNGIAEKLIVIVDAKGTITNIVGKKSLATPSVLAITPGSPVFDHDTNTMVTARQFGNARAIAVLDIAPLQSKLDRTGQLLVLLSIGIAAIVGLATFALIRPKGLFAAGSDTTAEARAA